MRLFLCGDVMAGRGIDQILAHPCDPELHERYVKDAREYVRLAERESGAIESPVDDAYIWGDAPTELQAMAPAARIINLETSVTRGGDAWPRKAVHYRMSPDSARSLAVAAPDMCALANNHVLDWGYEGLSETLDTLRGLGIQVAGAGHTLEEAEQPVAMSAGADRRLLVFSFGEAGSGIPASWAAGLHRPGVAFLADLSRASARRVRAAVARYRRDRDIVLLSIHWGPNWGFEPPIEHAAFARWLIDEGAVDLVHGHSSHHVKGIEVYQERLILYGCGDFLTDYEGISGYEHFRDDLGLMYFPSLDPDTGALTELIMTPTRLRQLRVNRASRAESAWLARTLDQLGHALGTRTELDADGRLALRWGPAV